MKIFSPIKFFFKAKWKFILPPKKRILIYDKGLSEVIIKFFKKGEYEILHTRFEEINIPILLISIFKLNNLSLSKKYIYQYINYVNPKLIISMTDNKISFYKLKRWFQNITIIAIQNGYRMETFKTFENVTKNDNLSIDYLFVMSEAQKKCYAQFIKGNIIVNGMIKNNLIPIVKKKCNLKKLLFISQYKNYPKQGTWFGTFGEKSSFDILLKPETDLIPLLANYCAKNDVRLEICGKTKSKDEASFFQSLIGQQNNNWHFYPRVDAQTTYEMLDQASAVANIDSTLGYEALARKKPTAAFSIRGGYNGTFAHFGDFYSRVWNFGLPKKFSDTGPFWTNHLNEAILNEILNLVLNINQEDWKKICDKYITDITAYDEGNKKFKDIMKTLNIPLVNEN